MKWTIMMILLLGLLLLGGFYFMNKEIKQTQQAISPLTLGRGGYASTIASDIVPEVVWEIEKSGAEEYLDINVTQMNSTTTRFCITANDFQEFRKAYQSNRSLNLSAFPINITKDSVRDKNQSERIIIDKISLDMDTTGTKCFDVTFPRRLESNAEIKIGWSSLTLTTTDKGTGEGQFNMNQQIFYNPLNLVWYTFFIGNNSDIYIIRSSDNGSTWYNETVVDAGTYDYDDFEGDFQITNNTGYIHLVYSDSADTFINYRRITLSSSDPYFSIGSEQMPFNSTAQGGQALDDVAYPSVFVDRNNCVAIGFTMEDDSEVTADEWEVMMTKEASNSTEVCGDGVFNRSNTQSGFPIESIQGPKVGYNAPMKMKLLEFNSSWNSSDLDAQLFWMDTDSATAVIWKTAFFNGTSNTTQGEANLSTDMEWSATFTGTAGVIVNSATPEILSFNRDDGTADIDVYNMTGKNTSTSSKRDTGLNDNLVPSDLTLHHGRQFAFIDSRNSTNKVVLISAHGSTLSGVISTNAGSTWGSNFSIYDTGSNNITALTGYYDNSSCKAMLRYVRGSATTFNVETYTYSTGSCGLEITVVNPTDDETFNEEPIILNITTTEAPLNCKANVDGTNYTMTNTSLTSWNYSISGLTEANHNVNFTCMSSTFANITTGNYNFSYSFVNTPNLTLISPTESNNSIITTNYTYINISSNDTESTNITLFVDFNSSLISWWEMDNKIGSIIVDKMRRNNATITGTVVQESGYFNQSLDFDGTSGDGFIDISNSLSSRILTLSAWVKRDGIGTEDVIFASDQKGFWVGFNADNTMVWFEEYTSGLNTTLSTTQTYTDTALFHHAVFVANGSFLKIYYDGVLQANVSGQLDNSGNASYRIGSTESRHFNGNLDNLMIFNRSMNDEEIKTMYANQSSRYAGINITNLPEANYTYTVYAQNQLGGINQTTQKFQVNYSYSPPAGGSNTCVYTSGHWTINMADHCITNKTITVTPNNMYFYGTGTFNINSTIYVANVLNDTDNGKQINISSNGSLIMG